MKPDLLYLISSSNTSLSPGINFVVLANVFSSCKGLSICFAGAERYNCTTSFPAVLPVLVILTFTVSSLLKTFLSALISEYAKVV